MRKYSQIFIYSARNQLVYLPAFIGRNLFFILIMFIFSSLWRVIYGGKDVIAGLTMVQVLWYFTLTEVIELSKSRISSEIQQEVKEGAIAYTLLRPFSYIAYYFFRAMGENIVKMVPVLIEAFFLAWIFAGFLPGYFTAIPFGLIVIVAGLCLATLWQLIIGLLAFWFEEVSPFDWIIQKLVFIVGGMFFPIDFFPEWFARISKSSPFAFSAYWPAITVVDFSLSRFLTCLMEQVVYGVALSILAGSLFAAAIRKVHVQGG